MLVQKLKINHSHMRAVILPNTSILTSAAGEIVSKKKVYDPKNFKSDLNHNIVTSTNTNNATRLFSNQL